MNAALGVRFGGAAAFLAAGAGLPELFCSCHVRLSLLGINFTSENDAFPLAGRC